eukprot:scaffold81338_cov14-Tisochrysis_lutea.AAC.1
MYVGALTRCATAQEEPLGGGGGGEGAGDPGAPPGWPRDLPAPEPLAGACLLVCSHRGAVLTFMHLYGMSHRQVKSLGVSWQ